MTRCTLRTKRLGRGNHDEHDEDEHAHDDDFDDDDDGVSPKGPKGSIEVGIAMMITCEPSELGNLTSVNACMSLPPCSGGA